MISRILYRTEVFSLISLNLLNGVGESNFNLCVASEFCKLHTI